MSALFDWLSISHNLFYDLSYNLFGLKLYLVLTFIALKYFLYKPSYQPFQHSPVNTKHLYDIYTMLVQRCIHVIYICIHVTYIYIWA